MQGENLEIQIQLAAEKKEGCEGNHDVSLTAKRKDEKMWLSLDTELVQSWTR